MAFLKNIGELIIGQKLSVSVKTLAHEIVNRSVNKDHFIEVLVQIFYRFTRVGLIALLLSLIPIWLLYQQNKILKNQNKLIETQIKQINNQNQLIESQRRSSLMFVYGNILEQIHSDLTQNQNSRELTQQTIGNIISLSKGLKPYRILEDSTFFPKPLSPERGQLLNTLLNSNISENSLSKIFKKADFSFSDLREFDLQNVKCIGCYLKNSEMHGSDISFSDFTGANLSNTCLNYAKIANTNFNYANLSNADFDEVVFFDSTLFNMAIISNPNWFNEIEQTGFNKIITFNSVAEKHVVDTIGFTEFDEKGISRYGFRIRSLCESFGEDEIKINQREILTVQEVIQLHKNIQNNPALRAAIIEDTTESN